jgi:hypothetical protein
LAAGRRRECPDRHSAQSRAFVEEVGVYKQDLKCVSASRKPPFDGVGAISNVRKWHNPAALVTGQLIRLLG